MRCRSVQGALLAMILTVGTPPTLGSLTFTPAAGYSATAVWSGGNAAHFAVDGGQLYVYGAESIGAGQFQNVVHVIDDGVPTEIARSAAYATDAYFPDAITVANGAVYWAHVQSFLAGSAANVYQTTNVGGTWQTQTLLDENAGANVYSLSSNGNGVFGTGADTSGSNVAFYFDDSDQYQKFADLPTYSGGSGFAPDGTFFGGAVDGSFNSLMYEFSAAQIADRLAGTSAAYAPGDAANSYLVPGNASAVMESDGTLLFGSQYNATFTGTDPFAFDLSDGSSELLGTLSGAGTTVATDFYYDDGAVYFMAKDDWASGGEAVIYRVVPEPTAFGLLILALPFLRRR